MSLTRPRLKSGMLQTSPVSPGGLTLPSRLTESLRSRMSPKKLGWPGRSDPTWWRDPALGCPLPIRWTRSALRPWIRDLRPKFLGSRFPKSILKQPRRRKKMKNAGIVYRHLETAWGKQLRLALLTSASPIIHCKRYSKEQGRDVGRRLGDGVEIPNVRDFFKSPSIPEIIKSWQCRDFTS